MKRSAIFFAGGVLAFGFPTVCPVRELERTACAEPAPATKTERWKGTAQLPGATLVFLVTFTLDPETGAPISGALDIPTQGVSGMAVKEVGFAEDEVKFLFAPEGMPYPARFSFKRNGDRGEGQVSQAGQKFPITLERLKEGESADVAPKRPQEPKPPFPYTQRSVEYVNPSDGTRLAGTLTIPRESAPGHPAVLLITGSGAQDRDESLLGHKPFLVIADYLTRRGVAVLRVDDRGVGGSTGDTMATPLETSVGDVLAGVEFLRAQQDIDARRIGLIGHSEGGLLAPAAAARSRDVAFIVMLAGTGTPGRRVWVDQTALISERAGMSSERVARQRAAQEAFVDALVGDADDETLRARARDVILVSVPDPATAEADEATNKKISGMVDQQLKVTTSPWFVSFIKSDPRGALQNVACPVLAMGGSLDLQVPPRENLLGIEESLRAGGNQDITVIEIPGLNHLFQTAGTGMPGEYSQIDETFSPRALSLMGDWICDRVGLSR